MVHDDCCNSFPSFQAEERKTEEEGMWKSKDAHKFLDNSPTEKWELCLLLMSDLVYALEDGSSDVVLVSNWSRKKNIWEHSTQKPWAAIATPDNPACQSLFSPVSQPSPPKHQLCEQTILFSMGQPTHKLSITNWPGGLYLSFIYKKLWKTIKMIVILNHQVWGIFYAAIDNQKKI